MTKAELKTGMIVTTREGEEYLFIKDFVVNDTYIMSSCGEGVLVNMHHPSWNMMKNYNNDLTNIEYKTLDIVKVEIANHPHDWIIMDEKWYRTLVWERKETKQMTVEQIEAILGYNIEIVSEGK